MFADHVTLTPPTAAHRRQGVPSHIRATATTIATSGSNDEDVRRRLTTKPSYAGIASCSLAA